MKSAMFDSVIIAALRMPFQVIAEVMYLDVFGRYQRGIDRHVRLKIIAVQAIFLD